MVKKEAGKKDDKKQPKDAFDPVLVESSQAATVVLMLDSIEEDVVVKASEAIYKFSEKCDANKLVLLRLETIPRVLKLIASESHSIHRNACLVLGSMSKYSAVARTLKHLDIIPTLLKLLGPDEDAVVNEYAALTLLSLAGYYSCKRVICDNKGLEPLIRCLSSYDADVQKNSIDSLTLLLEDAEVKKMIREQNGIVPVAELLKSEYAIIQSRGLAALRLIAEDASNRQAIRDAGCAVELVNIITNQSFGDLHHLAVQVLAKLFEDFETLQLMKENGTLKKLIGIASDIAPVVEEKKTKTKEKDKAGSPAKGKKGKASAAEDESNKAALPVMFVPLSADVKEQIALAFQSAAKNGDSRKMLTELELEKMLIVMLNHSKEHVQISASQAIRAMAESLVSRDTVGKQGGIHPLVKMITDGCCDVQAAAVSALSILTTFNEFNCNELSKNEGVRPLIELLKTEIETIADHVLTILSNMGPEDQLRAEIICSGVIPALVELLSFESDLIQIKVLATLCVFVLDTSQREQFVSCSGVPPLVDLLSSSNKDVRQNATSLIAQLAADEETSRVICHRGAVDILRYMQTSDLTNNYVDDALNNLLDCNLSAKYAITGRLSCKDVITDGFYDVGRLKLGKPFMPLSCYSNEPVNTKRAILHVCTQQPQSEESEEKSASSPVDGRLVKMIEEVGELLLPLQFTSDAERAIALAQYVACQMGGQINKGNFSDFSWELHISKLKYEHKCNVVPIGKVTAGIHYHRALLFKVIGDRTGIPSALVRGEFHHAWNELALCEESEYAAIRYPPKTYIVDLIFEPGRLMRTDSADAVAYQQL